MTKKGGIGMNGNMAWNCPEEMAIFKTKTLGSVLVAGKVAALTLPNLPGTIVYGLTHTKDPIDKSANKIVWFYSKDSALNHVYKNHPDKKIFIIGGASLYESTFADMSDVEKIHVSIMNNDYECDRFVNLPMEDLSIISEDKYDKFVHMTLKNEISDESQYLNILKASVKVGQVRKGRNGKTSALMGQYMCPQLRFNLMEGFPLLTTKKMYWKGIVEERLFFLRGNTNSKILENKNIKIWESNTNRKFLDENNFPDRHEGIMGPMYGYQTRHFNAPYDEAKGEPVTPGIDQLAAVVKSIKNDPMSRRHLMTTYNPAQVSDGVLPPCHSIVIQFFVSGNTLNMYCYNRSSDLFLGLPFNIASTALQLMIVAELCDLTPAHMVIGLGDAHVYEDHYECITTQCRRMPYVFPTVKITKKLKTIADAEALTIDDFVLENYRCFPAIKAKMVP